MRATCLLLALTSAAFIGGCVTSDLTGTKHTITFKRNGTPQSRLQGTYSLILANDWNGHIFRGKALSQAIADPNSGTLRFALPMAESIPFSPPICLAIVGPLGQVPISNNRSVSYTFRNPLWEEDLSQVQKRKQASLKAGTLSQETSSLKTRLDVVFRELQGYNARSLEECREGPPVPPPPRPITAVESENRPQIAAKACAAAWEDSLKELGGKLYTAIQREDIWKQRKDGAPLLPDLNIHLTTDSGEIADWEMVLARGESIIGYDEILNEFKRRTDKCEKAAIQRFIEHTKQWEAKVDEAAATPKRLLLQCQDVGQKHRQLSIDLLNAESKLARAEQELSHLRNSASSDSESKSLVPYTCTER